MNKPHDLRSIEVKIDLPVGCQDVFMALISPSQIRRWWSADRAIVHAVPGGYWMAAWGHHEDDPDYVCGYTLSQCDPPHRLVFCDPLYRSKDGQLPFDSSAMSVEFELTDTANGTRLSVCQSGFPADSVADEFYAGCQKGWDVTLAALREHLIQVASKD